MARLSASPGSDDHTRTVSQLRMGSLSGLGLAALGGPPPGGDTQELDRELGSLLASLPRHVRVGVRVGAGALDGASLLHTGRRLAALEPEAAAALLERLAAIAPLAPALAGLKALVALAAGARTAEAQPAAGSVPPARPDADLDVTSACHWPGHSAVDAVIVGSGAGGAMAARTLARAGLVVVVVEEGRRFGVEEFRARQPLERFTALYRDAGTTVALGRPPVIVPLGRGVGGTTLVNSGTCYRPPQDVLGRWHARAGFQPAAPGALEPYLDEVWSTLRVAPSPAEILGRNAQLVLEGAATLGWEAAPLQRNAPGCGGCCQCAVGCPRNAKYGVHLNALPQACSAGARILSEARVERVLTQRGRAAGILARRADGTALQIDAPLVLVAAGAVETPPLLRRSGLGEHPQLGRNLALHPAISLAGRFAEPVVAWQGVLQSVGVDPFHAGEGILLEATATPPGMGSLNLPGWGPSFRDELEHADHLATLGAMVVDSPSGLVLGRRRGVMTYRLGPTEGARLLRAIELAGRLLFAAGANEVLTGIPGHERARSTNELRGAVDRANPRHLHLAAFHPTGTMRAGADPVRYPVDPSGRLRGVHGVWICDASVLPSCPEVNPQVTIMAVALAIADRALAETSP